MNVITVSREYGLAAARLPGSCGSLGWDCSTAIAHQTAAVEQVLTPTWSESMSASRLAGSVFADPAHRVTCAAAEAVKQVVHAARSCCLDGARGRSSVLPKGVALRLVAPRDGACSAWPGWKGGTLEENSGALAGSRADARTLHAHFRRLCAQPEQFDLVVNTRPVALEEVTAWVFALVRQGRGFSSRRPRLAGVC